MSKRAFVVLSECVDDDQKFKENYLTAFFVTECREEIGRRPYS